MNTQTLFTGWHFMRWLRLVAGLFIIFQSLQVHDGVGGFIGAFFLFQAITNTGCCGTQGCAVPATKDTTASIDEVEYEELKTK